MVINHLAIWVRDLEKMKQFYGKYFSTESNGIYKNDQTGFRVLNGPRTTGDGYFESVILDPENNRIELTL